MASPRSQVGRVALELINELTPKQCLVDAVVDSDDEAPTFVAPPACTLSTAAPMYRVAKHVVQLMALTEQCLYRTTHDEPIDEEVLDLEEVEDLVSHLRTAVALTEHPIHEEFEYKPNHRTSLGSMLFVLETRLHLFCHAREWEATPFEDHASLADYPRVAAQVDACETPFLFLSLSQLWTLCKNLTDRWYDWNRDDASRVDVGALADVVHHAFARTALLVNTAYERDTLDVSEYVQPIEVGENPHVVLNHEFVWDFGLVFHALFRELMVFQNVMERAATEPSAAQRTLLARYRPHVHDWLMDTMASAVGDALVAKFEDFYQTVEKAVDVGLSIRNNHLQRLDFDRYKRLEELFEHSDPVIVDAAYKFALHYVLQQQCQSLPWLGYVCHERTTPRVLWTEWTKDFPRILRVPLVNTYCLVVDDATQTIFEHPLDAWIVWLYHLRDHCNARIRHPETGLWVSFEKLLRKFEIIVETKAAMGTGDEQ